MISFDHISFQYENAGKPALRDVSLTVKDGEYLAIVGHNGSGKSTLAKHINALLVPKSGTVTVDGMSTSDEDNVLKIRQHVGMVFQNPDNQLVTTIVEEDVAFGPENLGVPPKEIRGRVDESLAIVGMTEYAEAAAHRLSGGQKQRVAIAGMLAMHPDVLVLDEATAMLDPKGREELLSTILRLNKTEGLTIIMVTQYMDEICGCDRVIVMNHGSVAMEGTPVEIFSDVAALRGIGMDAPETVLLRDALLERGVKLSHDIITADELAEALCPLL